MTTKEEIVKLAEACGMATAPGGNGYWDNAAQMEAFYHAARKPLEEEFAHCDQVRNDTMLELEQVEAENEELRQQLAEKTEDAAAFQSCITAIGNAAIGYDFSGGLAEYVADTFKQLAAANAEIERLNSDFSIQQSQLGEMLEQLAASQLQNTQLRGLLAQFANDLSLTYKQIMSLSTEALILPTDTTALEAMIQKAGEVATRRAIQELEAYQIPVGNSAAGEMACEWTYDALKEIRDEIRALHGVTIGDLK